MKRLNAQLAIIVLLLITIIPLFGFMVFADGNDGANQADFQIPRGHLEVISYNENIEYNDNILSDMTMAGDLARFLKPNYDVNGDIPSLTAGIVAEATDDATKVELVANWVGANIPYDHEKILAVAEMAREDYPLDPDVTLADRSGICYDHSALITAMLRSQGLPTKSVIGIASVDGGESYVLHSWNEAWYTAEGETSPAWHPIAPPNVVTFDVYKVVEIQ